MSTIVNKMIDILTEEKEPSTELENINYWEPMAVSVSLTLYDVGSFDVSQATVQVIFDLHFIYDNRLWRHYFEGVGQTTTPVLPWMMANALELNVANSCQWYSYGKTLKSVNIFSKKTAVMADTESRSGMNDLIKFRCELYSIRATMKLLSFPQQDPFQCIYLVFKIAMDGTPGSEFVQFEFNETNSMFKGAKQQNGDFTRGKHKSREFLIKVDYGNYSRLYMMIEYKKSPFQDMFKYYLLPFVICIITLSSAGKTENVFDTAGAYFLAVVALIFTLPQIGVVTRNEKTIVSSGILLLLILGSLTYDDSWITQFCLWVILCLFGFINTIYDIWKSHKINLKNRNIIFDGDLESLDCL